MTTNTAEISLDMSARPSPHSTLPTTSFVMEPANTSVLILSQSLYAHTSYSPVLLSNDTTVASVLETDSVAPSNMSLLDVEAILQHLSDQRALQLLPVLIVYGIILLIGIFGNSLTVYIYSAKFKATWSRTAIVALGVFDLISCCCTIPSEVLDLRYSFNYRSDIMCRLSRLVATFPNIASGIMLTAVALDRYRLICTPLRTSSIRRSAWRSVLGVCVITLLVTWPAALVYGTMTKPTGIGDLQGTECSTSDSVKHTKIPLVYNLVLAVVFLTAFAAMIVCYFLIGRQVYKQGEFRKTIMHMRERRRKSTLSELEPSVPSDGNGGRDLSHEDGQGSSRRSCSQEDDTSTRKELGRSGPSAPSAHSSIEHSGAKWMSNGMGKGGSLRLKIGSSDQATATMSSPPASHSSPSEPLSPIIPSSPPLSPCSPTSPYSPTGPFPGRRPSRSLSLMRRIKKSGSADSSINARTRKTTFMLCFISIVFVLSFLPHIVVKLIRTVNKDFLTGASAARLIAYNLSARSYFLNSFANVFIYGFCSFRFRRECTKVLHNLKFWKFFKKCADS